MNNKQNTKIDYNSGMGINSTSFGPIQWAFMHMMSFNYPVNPTLENKKHYYEYIMNLQNILPCRSCRDNIKTNLKTCKFNMSKMKDRETFSRFVYDLHNCVNIMLGRKTFSTYEKVRDTYETLRAKCGPDISVIEKGCTVPLNNIKTRTVINVVPFVHKGESFIIDKRCLRKNSRKNSKKRSKKSKK